MKRYDKKTLESSPLPELGTEEAISFCLDRLYEDNTHDIREEIVVGLSFEELIGALLSARNDILHDREVEALVRGERG